MKKCKKCSEIKPLIDFYKVGEYKGKISYMSCCKKCYNNSRKAYLNKYRRENKEKVNINKRKYYKDRMDDSIIRENVNNKQRERYPRYVAKRLLKNAQIRALKKDILFDITLDDIVIPEICPILKIPLFTGTKGNYQNSPSLDRIDNTKGYIQGNVKVISTLANTMKNSATIEQLYIFTENIINYLNINDIVRTIGNEEPIELKDKEPLG